jgi:N-acyl-D-amino-acid deacylase
VTRTLLVPALVLALCSVAPAGDNGKLPITGPAHPDLAPFDELMTRFVRQHRVPGAALAVAKDGRLVYARGFGWADRAKGLPVQPRSLFRIASISKPITAVAILRLIAQGKLRLTDHPFELLALPPPPGKKSDPRLKKITVLQLLQHTGGFDRDRSFDPMFRSVEIARQLGSPPPADAEQIIRYMLGHKLDFEPGSRYAYSNFGYCVLGRVIEKVSGKSYEHYVRQEVLAPLGIHDMQIGQTLRPAPHEVHYYDEKDQTGPAVLGPNLGKAVPWPYGAWYLEAMDAHGGWIASAPDLVRFAAAFDRPIMDKLLGPAGVRAQFARPPGRAGYTAKGKPRDEYYGLGWEVRVVGPDSINFWHSGALDGTATILVHRDDGLAWAVLFNTRNDPDGENLTGLIDGLVHEAADRVRRWPQRDLFRQELGK